MGISYNGIFKTILKFTFFSASYIVLFHTEQSQAFLALVILSAWKALSFLLHRSLRPTVKTGCPAKPSPAQMKESSHMLCPVLQGVSYNTVCLTLLDSKILTPHPHHNQHHHPTLKTRLLYSPRAALKSESEFWGGRDYVFFIFMFAGTNSLKKGACVCEINDFFHGSFLLPKAKPESTHLPRSLSYSMVQREGLRPCEPMGFNGRQWEVCPGQGAGSSQEQLPSLKMSFSTHTKGPSQSRSPRDGNSSFQIT